MIRNDPESVTNLAQTAGRSLDHLIRTRQERLRDRQAEGLGGWSFAKTVDEDIRRVPDGFRQRLAVHELILGMEPPAGEKTPLGERLAALRLNRSSVVEKNAECFGFSTK